MFKKIVSILLALAMTFVFASCNNEKKIEEMKTSLLNSIVDEATQRITNAGTTIGIDSSISESSQAREYPENFDLRHIDTNGDGVYENYVTSVKQQSPFGTCWAFASIAAAETSILFELGLDSVAYDEDGNTKDSINLSEKHLAWFAYTPVTTVDGQEGEGMNSTVKGLETYSSAKLLSGSTMFVASSIFASGMGPVLEPDYDDTETDEQEFAYHGKEYLTVDVDGQPFYYSSIDDWSISEDNRFKQSYTLEDSYILPSSVSFDDRGFYDMDYANSVVKAYKEQLMNGRAITIAFCADTSLPTDDTSSAKYINNADGSWAHYTYDNARANHAVTIVGWDDNYSKDNFLSEVEVTDQYGTKVRLSDGSFKTKKVDTPTADGAWIVKNSWGSLDSIGDGLNIAEWGVDGSGYFYLSYYDTSIEVAQCFDFDVYDKLRQDLDEYVLQEYDFMPSELPHSVECDFEVSIANVFTAEDDETLKALSCTTTNVDEDLIFRIYEIAGDISNAKLLGTFSKEFEFPGIHVLELPQTFDFEKGEKFAIVITQKVGDTYLFSVGSEYNQKGFDAGYADDSYAATGIVNAGESYIYLEEYNYWWDFSEAKAYLESLDGPTSYLSYDNFPIKAYASIR